MPPETPPCRVKKACATPGMSRSSERIIMRGFRFGGPLGGSGMPGDRVNSGDVEAGEGAESRMAESHRLEQLAHAVSGPGQPGGGRVDGGGDVRRGVSLQGGGALGEA